MINFGRIIVSLAAIFVALFWVVVVQSVLTEPPKGSEWLGIVVLILGAYLSFFHRGIGRRFYAKAIKTLWVGTDSFWSQMGEHYTQRLYLVLGSITGIAGIVIIVGAVLKQ